MVTTSTQNSRKWAATRLKAESERPIVTFQVNANGEPTSIRQLGLEVARALAVPPSWVFEDVPSKPSGRSKCVRNSSTNVIGHVGANKRFSNS